MFKGEAVAASSAATPAAITKAELALEVSRGPLSGSWIDDACMACLVASGGTSAWPAAKREAGKGQQTRICRRNKATPHGQWWHQHMGRTRPAEGHERGPIRMTSDGPAIADLMHYSRCANSKFSGHSTLSSKGFPFLRLLMAVPAGKDHHLWVLAHQMAGMRRPENIPLARLMLLQLHHRATWLEAREKAEGPAYRTEFLGMQKLATQGSATDVLFRLLRACVCAPVVRACERAS
eukprot:4605611-Amphidinium_carterae.1